MPKGVYIRSETTKQFLRELGRSNKGCKKSEAFRNRRRELTQGSRNPMFGKPRTVEEKRKMSLALRNKGSHKGKRNGNWRGGISKLTHVIRTHPHYKRWRISIFERDNYTCQNCGKHGNDLNADHYPKTFAQLIKEHSIQSLEDALSCDALWDVETNRTLCVPCHRKVMS